MKNTDITQMHARRHRDKRQEMDGDLENDLLPWTTEQISIVLNLFLLTTPLNRSPRSSHAIARHFAIRRKRAKVEKLVTDITHNVGGLGRRFLASPYGDLGISRDGLHFTVREENLLRAIQLKAEEWEERNYQWVPGYRYGKHPLTTEEVGKLLGRTEGAVRKHYLVMAAKLAASSRGGIFK